MKMNLGEDPLDPHGDGTIREGDPMYQLLLNGPVQAIRSQEDPKEWDVHIDAPMLGRQVPEEFTNDMKEGKLMIPNDKPESGPGLGQKLFGLFWAVLGIWMLGLAFEFWGEDRSLNLAGQVLYVVIAGFNCFMAWFTLRKEHQTGKRW